MSQRFVFARIALLIALSSAAFSLPAKAGTIYKDLSFAHGLTLGVAGSTQFERHVTIALEQGTYAARPLIVDADNAHAIWVNHTGVLKRFDLDCQGAQWGKGCSLSRIIATRDPNSQQKTIVIVALNSDRKVARLLSAADGSVLAEKAIQSSAQDVYALSDSRILILYSDSTFQIWDWVKKTLSARAGRSRPGQEVRMLSNTYYNMFTLVHPRKDLEVWDELKLKLVASTKMTGDYVGCPMGEDYVCLQDYTHDDSQGLGALPVLKWKFKQGNKVEEMSSWPLPTYASRSLLHPRVADVMGRPKRGGPEYFYSGTDAATGKTRLAMVNITTGETQMPFEDAEIMACGVQGYGIITLNPTEVTFWIYKD